MKYLLQFLAYVPFLTLLLACSDELDFVGLYTDPRDGQKYRMQNVRGTIWLAENLKFQDSLYSYQQALLSCPEGWSLPSKEDWLELIGEFGGYRTYGGTEGDAVQSRKSLISGGSSRFNASEDYYWTSTPAWEDVSSIRSISVGFRPQDEGTSVVGNLISSKYLCRCVQRPSPEQGQSFARFKMDDKLMVFDRHPIFFPEENTQGNRIAFYIFSEADPDVLTSRISFGVEKPSSQIREGQPLQGSNPGFEYQLTTIDSYSYFSNLGGGLSLTITSYNGRTIKGTFSGTLQGESSVEVEEGEFSIELDK